MGSDGAHHESRFGTLRFDEQKFGHYERVIEELKNERGVDLMPIEESYVSKYLREHDALASQGLLARYCPYGDPVELRSNPWWGIGGMIDWTNPNAGDYWHDEKRQFLIDLGIHFHWTDLGEPEMFHPDACYHGFPQRHRHADIHNIYNFRWLESIHRGYERNENRLRPFLLSRSGTVGIQRFGAGVWSGDIGANMEALTAHYNAHMHMSMVGIDYFGSDVGGFHRWTVDGDVNKLYTQWLANASVFDFPVRAHVWNLSGDKETNPALIGHLESNRRNVRQRLELVPYYYSLAHRAHQTGEPVVPPMFYHFQEDLSLREIGNQKMIGASLMAAMVASYGQVARDVYLPEGSWYNFHSLEWHSGGNMTVSNVPAYRDGTFRIPLFARQGAIIPMAVVTEDTRNVFGLQAGGGYLSDFRVRVFAGPEPSRFELIEDDGRTVDYLDGETAKTVISQNSHNQRATIHIGVTTGNYEGIHERRDYLIEYVTHRRQGREVTLNGDVLQRCQNGQQTQDCWHNAGRHLVAIHLEDREVRREIRVEIALAPVMPKASAYFSCFNAYTRQGYSAYIVGSLPQLGQWDEAQALKLDPSDYPTWTKVVRDLKVRQSFEWQCLVRNEQNPYDVRMRSDVIRHSISEDGGYSGQTNAWL